MPTRFIIAGVTGSLFFFLMTGFAARAQETDFTGRLMDRHAAPVAGASVSLLNTQRETGSDLQGWFHFKKIVPGKYTLRITAIGYAITDTEIVISAGSVAPGAVAGFLLDESAVKLDDVVVTAQKKEELLQTVPVSVSAITERQVRDYRLWDNKELTAIVPNLYAADPGDGRDVISVRGITTTSYDPAVATYIDGVNQFGLDTYIPALFDVERIEVLRGPQGTLYGRNAMGGVINIITRRPSNNSSGFAEISAGSYGQQRYSAAFRAPLIKDRLFLGVAGLYEGRDGYYTNQFNGQSYDKQHSLTGNYYLKYAAGARWLIDLNLKHRNNRNNGAFPLTIGADEAFKQPFVLDQNALTTMIDKTLNVSLAMNYSGAAFNFSSQTAWQNNYRYYTKPIDGDFSPLDGISIINNYGKNWNNVRAITQDLKFTSPAASASRWKWTAGSYLFFQDAPNKQATRYGIDANQLGVGDSLFSTINTTKSHKWGLAFYGQAGYAISGKWNIGAGIRYDYERQEENVLGEYQHDPSPDPIVIRPDTSGTVAFHAISPELSLDFHLSRHTMLYASYSRGFRTGGLTQLSSDPSEPPLVGFLPEYSSNYEAGVKTSLSDGSLRLNADLFYNHISNAQVPTLVLPDAITVTKNAGRLGNKGVEAELSATPLRGLEIACNWGYTYSRFEKLELSQNGSAVDLAGRRQVFTPEFTSMLALQYSYPIAPRPGLRIVLRGEWKAIGTTWFDLNNTIKQTPYSLYNIRCGLAAKNIELMCWGRNIADKRYIAYAYDFGAVHLGDPRTWGLSLFVRIH